jgi:hypothetical protein
MSSLIKYVALTLFLSLLPALMQAQGEKDTVSDPTGYLSMGARNSVGIFESNGEKFFGTGAGGQFALQIAKDFNSHYFADWIVSNIDNLAQRFDFHSGFSMMPQVFSFPAGKKRVSLFPLAGICIDYTKFSITTGNNYKHGPAWLERYSFAVQAGCGATMSVSKRLDFSLETHYMLHIGTDIEIDKEGKNVLLTKLTGTNLEGHLFFAVSMDYKLFRLWRKKSS